MYLPLYNLALLLGLPFGAAALAWRVARHAEYRHALGERFGQVAPSPPDRTVIWLHAVSVGEVISAVPLVRALREAYPEAHLVVSCGTSTGRATALERLEGIADRVIYLAYDLPPLVWPAVRAVRPDLVLLVETEIWPNLLLALGRRRVPALLVNGRISRRSFPRYMRVRPLMRDALAPLTRLLMQTPRDASRLVRIGAPRHKVRVLGNIKYDQPLPRVTLGQLEAHAAALGFATGTPVLLAGSTHAGEEEALARVWRRLREREPKLVLVLAVRHPNRAPDVVARLAAMGIDAGRRSLGDCAGKPVVLLDTVGELAQHYALATVAFVGGSLVPVGGHNPLEPAAMGVPVVYGPHVTNFLGPCGSLEASHAAVRVADEDELAEVAGRLLADPDRRREMGMAGQAVFRLNQGAVARTLREIREVLDGGRP
ncbi:MAG: 3-deoxy-D-manno-octulosonic acid transferase [Nitrospirae bacterium]|nr:3-deoxy-D-manno-octulosonic acid transferase [Nitrospirota bacterium]